METFNNFEEQFQGSYDYSNDESHEEEKQEQPIVEQPIVDESLEDIELLEKNEWNFKEPTKNIVTEAFKRKYYTPIKGGKMAISSEGLKVLAAKKGYKELRLEMIKTPEKDGDMCIIKAVLTGYAWDAVKDKLDYTTVEDIGDATKSNAKSVSDHYVRMAATRATARVFRTYTNIGLVCNDELSGGDILSERKSFATEKQLKLVKKLAEKAKTSNKIRLMSRKLHEFKAAKPEELSINDCSEFIKCVNKILDSNLDDSSIAR